MALCVEPVLMNEIWHYVQATVHLDSYMSLLSTLPAVRHWRVYTEGKACTRCLLKAIEWVSGI